MSRAYEKLSIERFGRHLLTSGDLDPVYIALRRMIDAGDLGPKRLSMFLIAYWCFYHVGFACYAAGSGDSAGFWDDLWKAGANEAHCPYTENGRWPRGSERRHFRGKACLDALMTIRQRYEDPREMVRYILQGTVGDGHGAAQPLWMVRNRAEEFPLFGPWISFKIADMADRVCGVKVAFDDASVFMFKDPEKAAFMLFKEKTGIDPWAPNVKVKRENVLRSVTAGLSHEFGDFDAPPLGDRKVSIQEIETILCKWKSHVNGHYPLNNDIDEINEGLHGWCEEAPLAVAFKDAMPKRMTLQEVER